MPDSRDVAARAVQVVLYARVSSKVQAKEGFSIPAQLRLLRDYAATNGFVIAHEFTDVETAKASGRTNFSQMLAYLQKHCGTCRTILVEKTDRLYRNLTDYATLDELGVTIHLVRENQIIGPDSKSSEQFVHGIKVLVARNYSQNLGEETVKGMTEKARAGIYPSFAPAGYRNVDGPNGKRIIVPDAETAPVVREVFERFATGEYSVKRLAAQLRNESVKLRGRILSASLAHQILRKRLYMGEFDWDGKTYAGSHDPLVTGEAWQRVQDLLDARSENKTRRMKHEFAFTGLVRCGHCGCMLVGEIKKRRYVYYHCTGNRGKCPERFTREEVLSGAFAGILRELVIPPPVLEWLGGVVLESDRTEQAARDQSIKRLQAQCDRIEARIETMYMDKLDGRIMQEFFDKNAAALRSEKAGLAQKARNIQATAAAPIDQAVDMLRLTSRASELFLQQPAPAQRRFLGSVVEKASWQYGALQTTLFEPFEILRRSNSESLRKEKENGGPMTEMEIWLPSVDSN